MANETILDLSPIGVTPYSARGITETLELISGAAQLRRTVNGGLVNFSPPQFQKYKITWAGDDMESPALDGVFPGAVLTIECVTELAFLTGSGGSPERTAVGGSTRTEGSFTFYRPALTVMVSDFQIQTDEWGAAVSWRMDAEEL